MEESSGRQRVSLHVDDYLNMYMTYMATWRNGSAFDFDCLSLSKGCRFESCGGHYILSLHLLYASFFSICHIFCNLEHQICTAIML